MGDRFSDVCGAIDELKRSLEEDPIAAAEQAQRLSGLVDEALRMQARMEARLEEYEAFRDEVVALARSLESIPSPRCVDAVSAAPELSNLLGLGRPLSPDERTRAFELAESIRSSAADLERSLYRFKDAALALARANRSIKGDRAWVLDESEARAVADASGEQPWARWLPPSPHRERILRYLAAGRAHIADSGGPEQPPLIQFEDGGLMPLSEVRWSEEVRNFHPADTPPHPHGLRYRE